MISIEQVEYLKEQLVEEKENYKTLLMIRPVPHEEIVHCLNQIIEFKFLIKYKGLDSIYVDFKRLIKHYINAANQKEIGYDNIDIPMIYSKTSKLNTLERCLILEMFRRELRRKSYVLKSNDCDKYIDASRMKHYKQKMNFKNFFLYIALLSSSSIWALFASILIILLMLIIIIQPAPYQWMYIIDIKFIDFSKTEIINMISNLLSIILDLDYRMELKAKNILGVILLGFLKVLFLSIIINYFWKKIIEYFKIFQ